MRTIIRRVRFLNVVYYNNISFGSFKTTRHLPSGLCTALKYTLTNHPTAALERLALAELYVCCLKCVLLCSACLPLSLRARAWLIPLIRQNCTSSLNLTNSHTFNRLRNTPSHEVCSSTPLRSKRYALWWTDQVKPGSLCFVKVLLLFHCSTIWGGGRGEWYSLNLNKPSGPNYFKIRWLLLHVRPKCTIRSLSILPTEYSLIVAFILL